MKVGCNLIYSICLLIYFIYLICFFILFTFFLKHIIMKAASYIKNRLIDATTKSDKEESADLPDMSTLGGDEEVKEEKGLKILTLNKLLTRIPIISKNKRRK